MLVKATGTSKHTHLGYIQIEYGQDEMGQPVMLGGQGSTSEKKGHSHPITFDPETGIFIVEEVDGHTHELEEYVPSTIKEKKKSEIEKVSDAIALFKEAHQIERDSIKDAEESEKFYSGKGQWTPQQKAALDQQDRAAVTVNFMASKLDLLVGFQRQNRTDVRFAPIENSDRHMAKILDVVWKHIQDTNDFHLKETCVFFDESALGRGNYHAYIDYDEDIEGKIVIDHYHWKDALYGTHAKLDLSDCEYTIKHKMMSKAKAEQLWPDKKDKLEKMFVDVLNGLDSPHIDRAGDAYLDALPVPNPHIMDGQALVDVQRKEVRVMEVERKVYTTEYVLADPQANFVEAIRSLKESEAKEWATVGGINVIKRNVCNILVTTIGGNSVLLSEEYGDEDTFNLIPVYAKKMGDYYYGKIQEGKDVQLEINKRHSQAIDIGNKAIAYNWVIDNDTFKSTREKQNFVNNATKPGYVIEVKDKRNSPEKIEGARFPSEVIGLMENARVALDQILNVPIDVQGLSDKSFSGIALIQKRNQAMMANEFLFDNLSYAKRNLVRFVLKLIAKVYTPDRIMRLLQNAWPTSEDDMAEDQIERQAAIQLLQTLDKEGLEEAILGTDVEIVQSPTASTVQLANFAILFEMAKQGVPIPPEVLIEESNLANKDKILGRLQAQAEAAAKAEQQTQQAEIIKSLPDELQAQMLRQGNLQGTPPQGGQGGASGVNNQSGGSFR